MKRAVLLVLFFAFSALYFIAADEAVFNSPVGSSTDEVEKILQNFSRGNVLLGNFVQTKTVTKLGREFESRGDFLFAAEKGILWNVLAPFPSVLVLKEDSMIQHRPDGSRSVIDAKDNMVFTNFASAILSVFSGDFGVLEEHYQIHFSQEGNENVIGLIPRDRTMSSIVESLVLRGKSELESLLMHEASGDFVRYEFTVTEYRERLRDDEEALFAP